MVTYKTFLQDLHRSDKRPGILGHSTHTRAWSHAPQMLRSPSFVAVSPLSYYAPGPIAAFFCRLWKSTSRCISVSFFPETGRPRAFSNSPRSLTLCATCVRAQSRGVHACVRVPAVWPSNTLCYVGICACPIVGRMMVLQARFVSLHAIPLFALRREVMGWQPMRHPPWP